MKADIHPTVYPTIIVDTSSDFEFETLSTVKSEETREQNGTTYQVIKVEISSASHPFYTGEQNLVDTAGMVERFKEKQAKAKKASATRAHTSKRKKLEAKKARRSGNTEAAKADAKAALKAAKEALSL